MSSLASRLQWSSLWVLVLGSVCLGACGAAPSAPRNVVLVTIDTLRADHLGSWGYARDTSPFLDGLAGSGTRFANAWASSSHTAPSHGSLFTGLHPAQHRVLENGQSLDPRVLTLAQEAQRRGYRTAAFSTVSFLDGLAAGFEHFSGEPRYRPGSLVVDKALGWLQGLAPEDRFFVWVHLYDVHEWHRPERVSADALATLAGREGPRGDELLAFLGREHGLDAVRFDPRGVLDPAAAMDRYDAQIVEVDLQLRRLYETLEQRGLHRGTLWVVTSDHGEGLGNHGLRGHGRYLYNEQIRVPLIFHRPDAEGPGRVLEEHVALVDVAATLAEMLGGSLSEQVVPASGRSFAGLLRAGEPWREEPIFAQRRPADPRRIREGWRPGEVVSLQNRRFKVIAHSQGPGEVYDLNRDPLELVDLMPAPPAEAVRMLRQVAQSFRRMEEQGAALGDGEIDPRHREELKALGYL